MDIKFIHSIPYEKALNKEIANLKGVFVMKKTQAMNSFWDKYGDKIVETLEKSIELSFDKTAPVKCYLNSTASLSDPLSIKFEDVNDMRDNLIHELAHIILTQNNIGETKGWKKLQKDYTNEHPATRTHILVHAIHLIVTKRLFPSRKTKIQNYSKMPAYIRSWEIVEQEGEWNLLDRYLLKS